MAEHPRRTFLKKCAVFSGLSLINAACMPEADQLRTIGQKDPTVPKEIERTLQEIVESPLVGRLEQYSPGEIQLIADLRRSLVPYLLASSAESMSIRIPSPLYMRGVVLTDQSFSVTVNPYISYRPAEQEMGVLIGTQGLVIGVNFHTPRNFVNGRIISQRSFDIAQTRHFSHDSFKSLIGKDITVVSKYRESSPRMDVVAYLEMLLREPNKRLFVSSKGQERLVNHYLDMSINR
jgi:hypothetical protein